MDLKKIVVVCEPHADDSYLSCHQHIVDWIAEGKIVLIITVLSGTRKRAKDAKMYADSVGASWYGMGFDELSDTKDNYLKTPFNPLPGMTGMLYTLDDVSLVIPLSIQNPDHKAVTAWIKESYTQPIIYYAEIPYVLKHKNEDEVNDMMRGKKVYSIKKPKFTKVAEKYWKCFADQSKFFFYNPPESFKDIPEILLTEG